MNVLMIDFPETDSLKLIKGVPRHVRPHLSSPLPKEEEDDEIKDVERIARAYQVNIARMSRKSSRITTPKPETTAPTDSNCKRSRGARLWIDVVSLKRWLIHEGGGEA